MSMFPESAAAAVASAPAFWSVIDAIVDGREDCGGVRLAVVDSAVWVGLWRGGIKAEVGCARPEQALSEEGSGRLAQKTGVVG